MTRTFRVLILSIFVAFLPVTATSGTSDDPQKKISGTRAMERQVAQNPPAKTTDMEKYEYYLGWVSGVSRVCGDTRKAADITMLMRKSPYFRKGQDDTVKYDYFRGCGAELAEMMDEAIRNKLQWEMYLDATYGK